MTSAVGRARWIFGIAGIYGLVTLLPFYFAESLISPGLTHPEHYYGFIGGAAVMQLVYLTIAHDPTRFRPLMPIAVLAKLSFFVPVAILWSQGRTSAVTLAFATLDMLIGMAFGFAWLRLRNAA